MWFVGEIAAGESPQQIGFNITSYITLAVALVAAIGTFVSKKAKTPADELAKADFAYTKIKERLDEVDKDRKYLQSVVDALRVQISKSDDDANMSMLEKRKLRELVDLGDKRIAELLQQNRDLNDRLSDIADKVRNGVPITLNDVYGDVDPLDNGTKNDLGDLELTVIPERKKSQPGSL